MIEFIRELRERGVRTALLTNNVREWEPLWRAKLPEMDEIFELVVDSAFVGLRKPEPAIYELTLERLGAACAPRNACSWTTSSVNCEAARALGMAAVRFEDSEQAIAEIEAALRRSSAVSAGSQRRAGARPRSGAGARAASQAVQERMRHERGASGSRSSAGDGVELAPEHPLDLPRLLPCARWQPAGHGLRLVLEQQSGAAHPGCVSRGARAGPRRLDPLGQRQRRVDPAPASARCARTARARRPGRAPRGRRSAGRPSAPRRRRAPRSAPRSAAAAPRRAGASRASTSAWRVRSARTVRPSRCSVGCRRIGPICDTNSRNVRDQSNAPLTRLGPLVY